MKSNRSITLKRRESNYFRLMSDIFSQHITNSNISLTTVTSVALSGDSAHLKVYLVFENNVKKSMEAIERSKGFIRSLLANFSNERIVPKLHFIHDDTYTEGNKIMEILEELKNKKNNIKNNE